MHAVKGGGHTPRAFSTLSYFSPKRVYLQSRNFTGSARVLGYSVVRGVVNRVYGILQLKYGYSVYHLL